MSADRMFDFIGFFWGYQIEDGLKGVNFPSGAFTFTSAGTLIESATATSANITRTSASTAPTHTVPFVAN